MNILKLFTRFYIWFEVKNSFFFKSFSFEDCCVQECSACVEYVIFEFECGV